ncbi:TPA: hypothetical protein U2I61_000359 [Providencia rettgeri]|nr:hypothetical protein [Providencia rettgeri]
MTVTMDDPARSKILWWEKTVEYKFIIDGLNEKIFTSIAPLDGNEESVGDTLIGSKNNAAELNYYIIEFKKEIDNKSRTQEYKKYNSRKSGFEMTKKCLEQHKLNSHSKFHFLIYGTIIDKKLELKIINYFDLTTKNAANLNLRDAFSNGMTLSQFNEYTRYLTQHKSIGCNSTCSGGSGGGPDSPPPNEPNGYSGGLNSVVAGINHKTNVLTLFPLVTFKKPHNDDPSSNSSKKPIWGNGGGGLAKKIIFEQNNIEHKQFKVKSMFHKTKDKVLE